MGKQTWFKKYILDGLSAMAMGLFASLIIGLILRTSAQQLIQFELLPEISSHMLEIAGVASSLMGGAIGVAMGYKWKAPLLVFVSMMIVGQLGAMTGGPAGAYLSALTGYLFGIMISNKTPLDILLTPLIVLVSGYVMASTGGSAIGTMMIALGHWIEIATQSSPLIMGVLVSVSMGMILTLPISSAAIALMLNLSGLAAGAATAGCCAQMVGFAIMSRKENSFGMFLAQFFGTSMLQISNIIKNPWIWLPPTLASAITGPLATMVFKMENVAAGAGMGTSGLVGPLLTLSVMGTSLNVWLAMGLLYFVLPSVLSLGFYRILFHFHLIASKDCTIETV